MTLIVVDASVAIKWVLDEEPALDTDCARTIIGHFYVVAPRLIDFELASVLWVKRRNGALIDGAAETIALALQAAPIAKVDDDGLWLRALSLAEDVDHSPYDCAYVAAGLIAGAQAVVTSDRRFVRAFESWRAPHCPGRPFVLPVTQLDLIGPTPSLGH